MEKIFQIVSFDEKKSVSVVYGEENPLIQCILNDIARKIKILYISNSHPKKNSDNPNMQIINLKEFIESSNELVDYAIIFLEKQEDAKIILSLADKLEEYHAKIIVVVKVREYEKFINLIYQLKKKARTNFILLGDLFGKNISQNYSAVEDLVNSSLKTKTATLTGNDLKNIFPISLEDAQKGIGHILFSPDQKNRIHYLFYKHPQTIISAVHLIKRAEPDLEIKFEQVKKTAESDRNLKEIEEITKFRLLDTPYFFDINYYGFENSIKRIIDGTDNYTIREIKAHRDNLPKRNTKIKDKFFNFSLFIIFVFLSYLTINIFLFTFSVFSFKQALVSVQTKDFKSFTKYAFISHLFISFVDLPIGTLGPLFLPEKLTNDYELLKKGVEIIYIGSQDYSDLTMAVEKGKVPDFQKLLADLNFIYFELQKIKFENKDQEKRLNKILSASNAQFISLLQVLPELLSTSENKNYLILFQNNAELRPTGGFIGSVAELGFSKGKVSNFRIRDVYELDGQLKAHVEPHYIIRRYLQPHLYLRDSNFALNFEEAASTSALLYNLETKQKVDGVIAIDFEVLNRFIKNFGTIHLFDYNKTIDENNAFEFIQDTIQAGNFAGSSEKKNILSSIFDKISVRIADDPTIIFKFADLVPSLLKEKHILFAFRDNSIQPLFTINNLSGSLQDSRMKNNNAFYDFLSINEANIASNKANLTIKRSVNYDFYLNQKEATASVTLKILNSDKKAKDYFAYIRIITPFSSKLTSIKIDGEEKKTVPAITDFRTYEQKGFKPPSALELENSVSNGKQIFGFVTKVLKGKNQKIEISYKNAAVVPAEIKNYDLLLIKQPGTDSYPLKVNLFYEDSGKIKTKSFNRDVNTDQEINFNLK